MADIFICYAPEDRDWVRGLAGALSSAGFDVFWDLAPRLGQQERDVEADLQAAKAIVAVWSTASRNSNWVRDVAQEGFDRGKLVPLLKDIERPPLGFRQLRCADLRAWPAAEGLTGFDELTTQLREHVGAPADADDLDFERSTIIFNGPAEEPSGVSAAPAQKTEPSIADPSIASGSASLVTAAGPKRANSDLRPGDEIGQYRIVRRLGAGGFGTVYEASNIHNEDERVALKLLLANVAESERFAQLLKLEANALLRLKHAAVVQYRVFGRIAESDQFYLVTEFVPGPTLREWRRKNTPTLDEVKTLAVRLAQGLGAAHRRGIVHRDLAPDNVIVTNDDLSEAVLIDFGIARMDEGDTLSGAFAGKFSYAAPEQFENDAGRLGPSIDIYAFGLLIAGFARGKPLDMGRTMSAAKAKRLTVPELEDIPPALLKPLTALLQPDPQHRPRNMDDVARLFDELRALPEREKTILMPLADPSAPAEASGPVKSVSSAILTPAPPPPVEAPPSPEPVYEAPETRPVHPDDFLDTPPPDEPQWQDEPPAGPETRPIGDFEPRGRSAAVVRDAAYAAKAPKRRSIFVDIGVFLAVAIIGGGLTFFLWPADDSPPREPAPIPQPQPPLPEPRPPEPQPQPEPPTPQPQPPEPEPQPPEPQPQPPEPEPQPPEPQPQPPEPEPQPPEPQPQPPEPEPEPQPQPPEPQPPEPQPPEAPLASGKIETVPAGTRPQRANGAAYGKANTDARIVYIARRDTDLKVVARGKIGIERALKRGDSYRLPDHPDVAVSTSDAGALDVILDDAFIGRAGPDGYRLVDFQATPQKYNGPATRPRPPEPEPAPAPPEPRPPEPPPQPPPPEPEPAGDISAQALAQLNAIRQANGARAVRGNAALDAVAQAIAKANAAAGANRGLAANQVLRMMIEAGYGNAGASQNHARAKTLQAAFDTWRSVAGAAIVDANAVAMGIGMARGADGRVYWTLLMAHAPR